MPFLRRHIPTLLSLTTAFFFWKDYFQHPHRTLSRRDLQTIAAEYAGIDTLVSLPSGSVSHRVVNCKNPTTSFDVRMGVDEAELKREVPRGAAIAIAYNPEEEDKVQRGYGASAFSLVYQGKDYLAYVDQVEAHNQAVRGRLRRAVGTTLLGLLVLALVELVHRKLAQRRTPVAGVRGSPPR
jgi:hypothetical protein